MFLGVALTTLTNYDLTRGDTISGEINRSLSHRIMKEIEIVNFCLGIGASELRALDMKQM